MPLNSQLNGALRSNGRLGLGPCLEEKQMGAIDKIWGRLDSEIPVQTTKQLAVLSQRVKEEQPRVALVNPNIKRMRNEHSNNTNPIESAAPVFMPHN